MKNEEQKVRKIKDVTKLTGMIRALKATVAVGHGSLLTGFHQLSLKKLRLLSLKTQTSLIKSGLSLPISLDGGMRVVGFCWVVGWSDGCGAVVEWSWAMVAYGLWVVGNGSTSTARGVWLGTAASLSSFTPILSLRLGLGFGFGFGLIWRGI